MGVPRAAIGPRFGGEGGSRTAWQERGCGGADRGRPGGVPEVRASDPVVPDVDQAGAVAVGPVAAIRRPDVLVPDPVVLRIDDAVTVDIPRGHGIAMGVRVAVGVNVPVRVLVGVPVPVAVPPGVAA